VDIVPIAITLSERGKKVKYRDIQGMDIQVKDGAF
jgi:hypothetical protein